jgi:hypothetical protein
MSKKTKVFFPRVQISKAPQTHMFNLNFARSGHLGLSQLTTYDRLMMLQVKQSLKALYRV